MALETVAARVLAALDSEDLSDDLAGGIRVTIEAGGETTKVGKASTETEAVLAKRLPVFKTAEERFVLGVVLEPTKELQKPDSQSDVYSADEVRQAAYRFMEEYQTIGLQHRDDVSDRVKILLNWITLESTTINGQTLAAGTWLLGLRVLDDQLWGDIKDGRVSGLSIGGSATRTPVK